MRMTFFEIEQWERSAFESLEDAHQISFQRTALTADNAGDFAEVEVISPFIYSKLDQSTLEQLPELKLIATRSTGYDHIDINYCRDNDVTVCNVPEYGTHTVAEHVFALLLAISHHIPEAVDRTRRGDFQSQGLLGFDLHGKTLGIIGTGNIGRRVIHIAMGFGMQVLAQDIQPDNAFAESLGFDYVSLEELLQRADIVTIHVPGGSSTDHLLGAEEIQQMKEGAILINTARGNLIDVEALLQALANGRLAAAGLDVLAEEPVVREEAELLRAVFTRKHDLSQLLADHVLLHMRNVVITPHSAFQTREAVADILETTCSNISAFVAQQPQNVI